MIDIYGGIFLDIFIQKKELHNSTIDIKLGGSGFNIFKHLVGDTTGLRLFSVSGNDENRVVLQSLLKTYDLSSIVLEILDAKTPICTYTHYKPFAIQRGALDTTTIKFQPKNTYAIVTTELSLPMIKNILTHNYHKIFIDIGPRPTLLKEIVLPQNVFLIGNAKENAIMPCHVVKKDVNGASWGTTSYKSNAIKYPNTIGAGDYFTANFVKNYLTYSSNDKILEKTILSCEKYLAEINRT